MQPETFLHGIRSLGFFIPTLLSFPLQPATFSAATFPFPSFLYSFSSIAPPTKIHKHTSPAQDSALITTSIGIFSENSAHIRNRGPSHHRGGHRHSRRGGRTHRGSHHGFTSVNGS